MSIDCSKYYSSLMGGGGGNDDIYTEEKTVVLETGRISYQWLSIIHPRVVLAESHCSKSMYHVK